jgi:hypothetical protein
MSRIEHKLENHKFFRNPINNELAVVYDYDACDNKARTCKKVNFELRQKIYQISKKYNCVCAKCPLFSH